MPKLNLKTATRIKNSAGEITRLKGVGIDWVKPAPPSALAIFANPNANLVITDSGRRAVYTGTPGTAVGNCLGSHAILEPTYFEVVLTAASGVACGLQFYNGLNLGTPINYAPLGQWYGEPGATIMLAPTWVVAFFANYGLPEEVSTTVVAAIDGAEPVSTRLYCFVDGNRIWFRPSTMTSSWVGGGNPQANTTPSLILPGSGSMQFGAASSGTAANTFLLHPDDYNGGAMIPARGRRGIKG